MLDKQDSHNDQSPNSFAKLGILAGHGALPKQVIAACHEQNRPCFVIAFNDITEDDTVNNIPHHWEHIAKVGKILKRFKSEGVTEILMAGRVGRPPLTSLRPDFSGWKLLATLKKLPTQGDDQVFSAIINFIEKSGFDVVGAESILQNLLIEEGTLGSIEPDEIAEQDIILGAKSARAIGHMDIGQAVIVQQGCILGVEGVEGTDRLISRCAELHTDGLGGVLVKMKKPQQDSRVDLPSIGVHTIENAYRSGLRGIAVEAGGALVIDRKSVIDKADERGIFITGVLAPTDNQNITTGTGKHL